MTITLGSVTATTSVPVAAPDLTWQRSLFGIGEPHADASFGRARRIALDPNCWIELIPGWLSGSEALFESMLARLHWSRNEMPMYGQLVSQPRLSAWWDLADEAVRAPLVAELAELLGRRYQVSFTSMGANLYRDGNDRVAWHADRHGRDPESPDVVVAVLSLGSPRRFALRPRTGGRSRSFTLAGGDLLVMGGGTQRAWQHCVPAQAHAGPRLSLTFRHAAGEGWRDVPGSVHRPPG